MLWYLLDLCLSYQYFIVITLFLIFNTSLKDIMFSICSNYLWFQIAFPTILLNYVYIEIIFFLFFVFCFSFRKASWFLLDVKRVFFGSPSFGSLSSARLKKELEEWEGNVNSHMHPQTLSAHPYTCTYKLSYPQTWKLKKHSFYKIFWKKFILSHLHNLCDLDMPCIIFCNYKFCSVGHFGRSSSVSVWSHPGHDWLN